MILLFAFFADYKVLRSLLDYIQTTATDHGLISTNAAIQHLHTQIKATTDQNLKNKFTR